MKRPPGLSRTIGANTWNVVSEQAVQVHVDHFLTSSLDLESQRADGDAGTGHDGADVDTVSSESLCDPTSRLRSVTFTSTSSG